jgi:hypothetical protein
MYRTVQVMGYADDINILGRSKTAVSETYTALENQAKMVGLSVSTDKTKALVQTRKQWRDKVIHLNNTDIEIVDSFTYLVSGMNTKNDEIIEMKRRLFMAKRAYFSMIQLLKSRTVHRKNEIRMYKTIVQPILCYDCETWTVTNKAEQMFSAFERKILRRIFGPTQDTEIYDLYKGTKGTELIKFRRLQWAGHVIRMKEHHIPKKALHQTIHCKIQVGELRKQWEDGVREDAIELLGIQAWKTKAKDREFWRQCTEEAKA